MVPRGAAQHDLGVVLPSGSLPPQYDRWVYPNPHLHCLVDADHLDPGHPALLHPRLSWHPCWRDLCYRPRALVDDPADILRNIMDFLSMRGVYYSVLLLI